MKGALQCWLATADEDREAASGALIALPRAPCNRVAVL